MAYSGSSGGPRTQSWYWPSSSLNGSPSEQRGIRTHGIIEWPGLKRPTMINQFQPPAMYRVTNQQTRLPRATSSLALNACRDGASTASLGNLLSASPPSG